jgi:hypothetical protein
MALALGPCENLVISWSRGWYIATWKIAFTMVFEVYGTTGCTRRPGITLLRSKPIHHARLIFETYELSHHSRAWWKRGQKGQLLIDQRYHGPHSSTFLDIPHFAIRSMRFDGTLVGTALIRSRLYATKAESGCIWSCPRLWSLYSPWPVLLKEQA